MSQLAPPTSRSFVLAILLALGCYSLAHSQDSAPQRSAHAHNDYYHQRPLLDALGNGFCSVEADVFLVDDQLLVGHSRAELSAEKTLKQLYLDPLKEKVEANGGWVLAEGVPVILLVDIKANGKETYLALDKLLAEYKEMLTYYVRGRRYQGPVQVIVSGDRDYKTIAASEPRFAAIDGRFSDLEKTDGKAIELDADLIPLISDNWRSHFRWMGKGEFPLEERNKLHQLVREAHEQGCIVRFWATPESPALWKELLAAKVDLIGTDQLEKLNAFLSEQHSPERQ